MTKEYLGDSVYIEFCSHENMVTITTENGLISPSNTIFMDMETLAKLVKFAIDNKLV